ncbi:E3 ubiquitin-protein ligase RNF5 [Nematocida sp. AWRm80]|nr:E3 ubiquitin-protein ligase RNF5 [Nematocida sp. AWRm80]
MQEEIVSRRVTNTFDFDCSICLSEVDTPVVTQCGHLFCWPCIYGWGKRSTICPVCKSTCHLSMVIPIYSKGTVSHNPVVQLPPRVNPKQCLDPYTHALGYNDTAIRILHMDRIEYRRTIGTKQCIFTKIFYGVILLFCIIIFLLLE